jgi:hypothetical protein
MASEILQNFGPAERLNEIDRLIEQIESELPARQGTDGKIIEGDQQTRRILRVLRILRSLVGDALAKPDESENVDFRIYGGGVPGLFVDDEGKPL